MHDICLFFSQDFLEFMQHVNYFIYIDHWGFFNVESLTLDNGQTKEKLVIKNARQGHVTVSRYPMDASDEWIEGMNKKPNNEYRNILIRI